MLKASTRFDFSVFPLPPHPLANSKDINACWIALSSGSFLMTFMSLLIYEDCGAWTTGLPGPSVRNK